MAYLNRKLAETFDIKLLGRPTSFIGWEFHFGHDDITLTQSRYLMEILKRHNLHYSNGAATPFPSDLDFSLSKPHDVPLSKSAHALYRASICELLYLAVCTRPDVSCAVSYLARAVYTPSERHALLLKRVLRYLSGTIHLGIKTVLLRRGIMSLRHIQMPTGQAAAILANQQAVFLFVSTHPLSIGKV